MKPVGNLASQQVVHDAMPLNTVLSAKNVRDDSHAHVRRLPGNGSLMADMLSALVNYLYLLRRKRSGELSTNSVYSVHKNAQSPYIV